MRIQSNYIYTEQGCIRGTLEVQSGRFQSIHSESVADDAPYANCLVLPGFIDIHTHGFQGHHAQAIDKDELIALKKAMVTAGVTSFLPTAGAHFKEEYENLGLLADVIEEQKHQEIQGAVMLGIHMEGPFLNPERRGAFQPYQLLKPDINKAESYLKASRHHILYMALSCELDPYGELIQYLKEQGVVVACAHTMADYETFTRGITQGICASTHTGNGMRQIDRRDVGALGAALLHDDIYCEMICDYHHIDPQLLELMFRIRTQGARKCIMISDSTEVSGYSVGTYVSDGLRVTVMEDGLIRDEEGTIMGSTYGMLHGFRNLKNRMRLPMEDILMMTSLNPARLLHLDERKGSIKEGKDADFIILDAQDRLLAVYVEGCCVYQLKNNV